MAAMRQAWRRTRSTRGADTDDERDAAQRLLNLGRDIDATRFGEVYRDPDAIEAMCATIERFLPGVRAGRCFISVPSVR